MLSDFHELFARRAEFEAVGYTTARLQIGPPFTSAIFVCSLGELNTLVLC